MVMGENFTVQVRYISTYTIYFYGKKRYFII
ncbi:hypothetical protein OKW21_003645 [Catalinimonas alkaloidigena]|nr:hypothetical protein [Catalinimonas alkaloidigena]